MMPLLIGTETIAIAGSADIVRARGAARSMAAQVGLSLPDQTRLATAVSELARNAVQYAGNGECLISDISSDSERRIRIVVSDRGPGIHDIDKAMLDGYSTGGGLGAGLPGTRRLVDTFNIESRPGFTQVLIEMGRPR